MNCDSSITKIKGVGEKTAELFSKMGVYTVGDILLRFPRDYFSYPTISTFPMEDGLNEGYRAILAPVSQRPRTQFYGGKSITTLAIGDEALQVQLTWFNSKFMEKTLIPGKRYVFFGKVFYKNGRWTMAQPKCMKPEEYRDLEGRLEPIYSLTEGMHNRTIIKAVKSVLAGEVLLSDYLPKDIREEQSLAEYNYAIKQIHFPDDMDALVRARRRLVFDEFFLFIMGMQYQKERQQKEANGFSFCDFDVIDQIMKTLPYPLTGAQKRTIMEIQKDMSGPYRMQRLVQGDVGSGKTIVAFLMMAWTSLSGYQSAIMAPTEVLARQHYESFTRMVEQFSLDTEVILLTGSMTQKEKRIAYERLQTVPNAMVVGTHALIQEKSIFSELALVITDEQHRFGVKQRDTFSEKGKKPHILVMSATPIPRTLAIILYGDLDISVIDEVPAKRLPIKNCVVNTSYREKAYSFIREQVEMGHQAYVICPLVEETENLDAENVEEYSRMLRKYYGGSISVGMLHGKMKNDEKNRVMEQFARNEIQVLVSTTVVEVGVNVPNATVMMIENADRFGLAQLHQLRGRVGRGDVQSYCIMINTSPSKNAAKRLEILNRSNDGFFIAAEDLKLRGPGDFFGIRQSGDLAFQIADIYQDSDVLTEASGVVHDILSADPGLEQENHLALHRRMEQFQETQLRKMNL
ncbi:MAG: ATP-dependent DNA helicase RecG [Lachnospiraceae bacterium]|nr:ATP-dependent DNA helicase RecG [Lachnospiraceae bacterium]